MADLQVPKPGTIDAPRFALPAIPATMRNFETQLDICGIPESAVHGKRVLNLGAGISPFIQQGKDVCDVYGYDPLYDIARKTDTWEEFVIQARSIRVDASGAFDTPEASKEAWNSVKSDMERSPESYLSGAMPNELIGTFDYIVSCQVTAHLHTPALLKDLLFSAHHLLSANGQASIYPFDIDVFPVGPRRGERATLINVEGGFNLLGSCMSPLDLSQVFHEVTSQNARFFIAPPRKMPYLHKGDASHQVLIICRGERLPEVRTRAYRDPSLDTATYEIERPLRSVSAKENGEIPYFAISLI